VRSGRSKGASIDASPADKNNAGSDARGRAGAAGAPARDGGLAGQRLALAGEQNGSRPSGALLRLFYQVEIRDLQLLK